MSATAATSRTRRRRAPALDVVVAGGGMAGATAALALAHEGFTVAIIESREPRPWQAKDEVDLRVVALAPSSARLLDTLGVWSTIRDARVGPYRHMHVWDAGSGGTLDFDACGLQRGTLGWIVENRLVQHTLWQALAPAGVRCLCPAQVEDFTADDGGVRVDLADGSSLEASLLVAADGAASPLRVRAGIGTTGRDYAQRGVVAHVRTQRPHGNTAWQRFLPTGPIALLPLADGRCSIVWTLPETQAEAMLALSDTAFCEAVGVATDFRLGLVSETSSRGAFPLRLQLAERYMSDRMVLLGDAAHVVHPLAGQGVNLGLRDVAELRDTLVAAREGGRDIGIGTVLRRYARRRRSADTLDARVFDAIEHVFMGKSAAFAPWRGLGMRILDHTDGAKRLFARHAAGI
ncbi:FAD-dependent monooxygenase [Oleiagrimonas sp.]|jgi:2-octaprenylphenol hydroxylase|uniref:FAD-dependent monooxygenase n=1 Tax=Oleiagrimonas sp. TaxID=2010330 RepID=UPI00260E5326|nr:FAD-dependent monooxygenase [Oleiagrimonas sp.]MDA3913040.1 FAD-dependent monooxygenase [Oleiagrimonas sp.]